MNKSLNSNMPNTNAASAPVEPAVQFGLQDAVASLVRTNIPRRLTNAEGLAAYGRFEVTGDISAFTSAGLFSKIGNTCRVFIRFSSSPSDHSAMDYDAKGFAVKFYTEQGNWDLVGSHTPVFYLKDPGKFPAFTAAKRKSDQNAPSREKFWDFCAQNPETLHQLLMVMSDRGNPSSYIKINGYGAHTYSLINKEQERFWVKFHFISENNGHNVDVGRNNNDSHQNATGSNLTDAIADGKYPRWKMCLQVMTEAQAKDLTWNPFDVTKVWLHDDFPLREVGVLELNELPTDYLEEVEKSAFSPSSQIEGIGLSPDPVLQARLWSYRDAQRYRLGTDPSNIVVNKNLSANASLHANNDSGSFAEYASIPYEEDHYTQPGLFYTKALETTGKREILINNIIGELRSLKGENAESIIFRQLCHLFRANLELGMKVAMGLGINIDANMIKHMQP